MAARDAAGIVDWIDEQPAGVVLATIHMGDYLHAALRVIRNIRTRKILILRRRPRAGDDEVFSKLALQGIPFEVLPHGEQATGRLVRELRRGALTLGFFDLTAAWGRTWSTRLLGRPANLAAGPSVCAAMARCAVLPMAAGVERGRPVCDFGMPLDVLPNGSVEERARRIAGHVERFASRIIRRRPSQWHHWNLALDMFFESESGSLTANHIQLPVRMRVGRNVEITGRGNECRDHGRGEHRGLRSGAAADFPSAARPSSDAAVVGTAYLERERSPFCAGRGGVQR
jgi:hypothetical protein